MPRFGMGWRSQSLQSSCCVRVGAQPSCSPLSWAWSHAINADIISTVITQPLVCLSPCRSAQACARGQLHKCHAKKTFSIIGILCCVAALTILVINSFSLLPNYERLNNIGISFYACLLASFCYMIIWTIAAHDYNNSPDYDDPFCGVGYKDSKGIEYGYVQRLSTPSSRFMSRQSSKSMLTSLPRRSDRRTCTFVLLTRLFCTFHHARTARPSTTRTPRSTNVI